MLFSNLISSAIAVLAFTASSVYAVPQALSDPSENPDKDFPPNFVVYEKCRTDGPVTACLYNRGYNELYNPRVKITYSKTGSLWNQGSPLSMWIRVNDKNGNFGRFAADPVDASNQVPSASFTLGSWNNQQICYRATVSDDATYAPQGYRQCPVNSRFPKLEGGKQQGRLIWFWDPAPADQVAVIPNPSGLTWNVEVAIRNDRNNWDSRNGANYRFTL